MGKKVIYAMSKGSGDGNGRKDELLQNSSTIRRKILKKLVPMDTFETTLKILRPYLGEAIGTHHPVRIPFLTSVEISSRIVK